MAGIKFFAPGNEVKTRMLTRVDMARSVFYQFFLLAAPTLLALLQEVNLEKENSKTIKTGSKLGRGVCISLVAKSLIILPFNTIINFSYIKKMSLTGS